jgi:multidrug efflux pump subunit AcrA (membrane-fusion protein)
VRPAPQTPPTSISGREPHEAWRYAAADDDIARLFRLAAGVTIALVIGLGGWAALTSISGAVIASGAVAVDGKRKVVQHLDGGVIAAVHVKEGASITAGSPIITLDNRELKAELSGLDKEIAARQAQIALIKDELKGLEELAAKQLVPRTRIATLQREAASLGGDVARLAGQKAKVEARLVRVEVKAPATGRVLNLLTNTVGGVIAPNSTIAEIVPSTEGMVVEARLAPGDVDQVRPGQPAQLRMTSFNQRSTPTIEARVEQVSADLMREEARGRDYYLVRVVPLPGQIKKLGGKALVPGMPAEVMIETGGRSVLSYLVKPLSDQLSRSMREE